MEIEGAKFSAFIFFQQVNIKLTKLSMYSIILMAFYIT